MDIQRVNDNNNTMKWGEVAQDLAAAKLVLVVTWLTKSDWSDALDFVQRIFLTIAHFGTVVFLGVRIHHYISYERATKPKP
jgi:hypothetical protein